MTDGIAGCFARGAKARGALRARGMAGGFAREMAGRFRAGDCGGDVDGVFVVLLGLADAGLGFFFVQGPKSGLKVELNPLTV